MLEFIRNYGILVGQVLVTKQDFHNDETREQLFNTIMELMALNIIPIINTNDAVSPPPPPEIYSEVIVKKNIYKLVISHHLFTLRAL